MTKFLRRFVSLVGVLAVLGAVLALSGHLRVVDARITGVNPVGTSADEFCVGKKSFEVCVDYLGNWTPTTTNTQSLGTSSLVWSNIYATNETVTNQLITGQNSLSVQTTTQISVLVPVQTGALVLAEESVSGTLVTNTFNVCASTDTKAGDFVYVSVSTSAAAVLGAKCSS